MLKEEMIQMNSLLTKFTFTDELTDVIENCKGVFVPTSKAELYDMVFGPEHADVYDVVFDVPGKGQIKEADVVRCKNGASVNFAEDYMRRREPDCMRIADRQEALRGCVRLQVRQAAPRNHGLVQDAGADPHAV